MAPEDLKHIRKRRLKTLIEEAGSQKELAKALDVEPNYISQLLKPGKSFAEKAARNIERRCQKPVGWLDSDELNVAAQRPTEWPFSFDRSFWDRLPLAQKAEIEAAFQKMVLGASVQDMAVPASKKRTG